MTKINAYVIEHFLSPNEGRDLYLEWLIRLRDTQAKVAVIRRVARMETGNFGDFKFCRDGDKRSQQGDIDRAVESWKIWQKENKR